jgi:hypothetical protein
MQTGQANQYNRKSGIFWSAIEIALKREKISKQLYYYYLKCLLSHKTFYIIFLWRITVRALIYGIAVFLK